MNATRTREAAEAVLRELPSVLGAAVREDVNGHPREVHLLVKPGPNVGHLARDIRTLLEERLGVPIDQRVISIAQLTDRPGGMPLREWTLLGDDAVLEEPGRDADADAAASRLVFAGLELSYRTAHVGVIVRLRHADTEHVGEAEELRAGNGMVRAAATAALRAATAACGEAVRFDLEAASLIRAFERDYALVSALAFSPALGRRPVCLAAAHPAEGDPRTASALAALKAINRIAARALA